MNYTVTYAPVGNIHSIRVYLLACFRQGFPFQQYDVDTEFLNWHLKEFYNYPPRGGQGQVNKYFLLERSLYDLKQAAATWFEKISEVSLQMVSQVADQNPRYF